MGVVEALDWKKYYDPAKPHMLKCASATLAEITRHVQKSLGIPHVKVIGERDQAIKNIALLPGAAGGNAQISILQKEQPDVLIVGEINEWETAEYIRDAQQQGKNVSLIVLGHAVSEEPGMKWMADWLRNKYATLKIQHIPSSEPFRYT
jgi:putative NIF3 family GTP cyclohydrolase 1 type 2